VAEAWSAIKDTNSIPALEAFIRRYGNSFYGDLAKARLEELAGRVSREATSAVKKKAADLASTLAKPLPGGATKSLTAPQADVTVANEVPIADRLSAAVGQLRRQMIYKSARNILLEAGWQPAKRNDECQAMSLCDKAPEAVECTGASISVCRFQFVDASGRYLVVITGGEWLDDKDPLSEIVVVAWSLGSPGGGPPSDIATGMRHPHTGREVRY
jgi:hypothetical protein